jgi:hypothetical protein
MIRIIALVLAISIGFLVPKAAAQPDKYSNGVVTAEAGTHARWIPAFAGMTRLTTERSEESRSA